MKHGKCNSTEYGTWRVMLERCNNPNSSKYKLYGGRGIKVCERWHKFEDFYEDMGDKPKGTSIDRIDNNKGYSPDNCRWATIYEQSSNKRNNVFIEFRGVKRIIAQWARILEMNERTLQNRLNIYKWPIEKAFTEPVRRRRDYHG